MIYRGIVENNLSKVNKVQVRIFGVHSQDKAVVPTEALPWAEVQGSTSFGLNNGIGASSVLQIGTWVWLQFEGNDIDKPVVTGTVTGIDPITNKSDVNSLVTDSEDSSDIQVIQTKSGHQIILSDVVGSEYITVKHKSGSKFTFDKTGNMSINCKGDISVESDGDIGLKCNNATIDASKIDLGVGGDKIARVGDNVKVSTSTGLGSIISSTSVNTSI